MEDQEIQAPKTRKFSINYGLLLGGINIVFAIMLAVMELHYQRDISQQIIGVVILAAVIGIAIYQFKKANASFLSLGQAIKIGLGVALIASLMIIVYSIIYTSFIEPEFYDKFFEQLRPQIAEQNPSLTTEQIDNVIQTQRQFAWIGYPVILIINLIIALIISLIVGLIMKKDKSDY
ncbi:DUF4199 family protein [Leptobacterium flavescens]|uniref:DUF4199 family protein n=1 Tax=Leptobacterium flavescens TaxID=472055 RepID=A0A6P0UH93_9FLAO|nr:DUF4199 domain-containing protein [Leptobacterium flavescens]NER12002.1 DUF4199 family protein [Leptobacterium flavescens]